MITICFPLYGAQDTKQCRKWLRRSHILSVDCVCCFIQAIWDSTAVESTEFQRKMFMFHTVPMHFYQIYGQQQYSAKKQQYSAISTTFVGSEFSYNLHMVLIYELLHIFEFVGFLDGVIKNLQNQQKITCSKIWLKVITMPLHE